MDSKDFQNQREGKGCGGRREDESVYIIVMKNASRNPRTFPCIFHLFDFFSPSTFKVICLRSSHSPNNDVALQHTTGVHDASHYIYTRNAQDTLTGKGSPV